MAQRRCSVADLNGRGSVLPTHASKLVEAILKEVLLKQRPTEVKINTVGASRRHLGFNTGCHDGRSPAKLHIVNQRPKGTHDVSELTEG